MNRDPHKPSYELKDGKEVRQELYDIFDPLAETAAEVVFDSLGQPDLGADILASHSMIRQPSGYAYMELPPNIFGDKGAPATEDELSQMIDSLSRREPGNISEDFFERMQQTGTAVEQVEAGIPAEGSLRPSEQLVFEHRIQYGLGGYLEESVESGKWNEYAQNYEQLKANGGEGVFLSWQRVRKVATETMDGNHRVWSRTGGDILGIQLRRREKNSILDTVAAPTGAYGEAWTAQLLAATAHMQEVIDSSPMIDDQIEQSIEPEMSIIDNHTARGGDSPAHPRVAVKESLEEGVLSIFQTVSMLTAEKVPGYDSPVDLLRDLVQQGVVERVARMIPMGLIGPLALTGKYLPEALHVDDEGKVGLTEGFKGMMYSAHGEYMKLVKDTQTKEGSHKTGLGLTCPVAGKNGGIRKLSEAMLATVEAL